MSKIDINDLSKNPDYCVKSNMVNRCVRTWYTHHSLEICLLISFPLSAENSAILKLR